MEILPRPFGDNLTAWFKVLGSHWKPLLRVSLLGFIPAALATVALLWATDVFGRFEPLLDEELVDSLTEEQLWEILGPFLWTMGIWALLMVIPTVFVYLASTRVVGSKLSGSEHDAAGAVTLAIRRLPNALIGGLALALLVFAILGTAGLVGAWLFDTMDVSAGSVFLTTVTVLSAIVVSLWLGLACGLYAQAIGFEDAGSIESLSRSFRLVRTRWWITFGFLAVVSLISTAVAQLLSGALFPLFLLGSSSPWVFALAYGFITLLQGPVAAAMGAGYAIWYLDLRARQETVLISDLVD